MKIPEYLLIELVKDLEDTRDIYHGYSYVRTIRNILAGNKDSEIAAWFEGRGYYGICRWEKPAKEEIEHMMDKLVKTKQLCIDYRDNGKLYCTPEYFAAIAKNSAPGTTTTGTGH